MGAALPQVQILDSGSWSGLHQVRYPAPCCWSPDASKAGAADSCLMATARSARARTSGAILSHSAPDGVFAAPIAVSYRAASEFRRTVQIW